MTARGLRAGERVAALVAVAALAWLLALAVAPHAHAANESVTLDEYAERVGRAQELAHEAVGKRLDARAATDLAIQINALVPLALDVETPDGVVTANHSLVRSLVARLDSVDEFDERSEAVEQLDAQLTSLADAIGRPGEAVPQDADALAELLGEQEARGPSPLQKWLGDLADRISRALQDWWESLNASPGARSTMNTIGIALLVALAALLLFLLARLALRVRAGTARRREAPAPPGGEDAVVVAARDLPADPLAYADARAADGDMREAIRALFGGAARALQERGYIVEARTRTNRELLLEIRPRSESVYAPLSALSAEFERVWYGHRQLDANGYSAARERFVEARAALEREGGEAS